MRQSKRRVGLRTSSSVDCSPSLSSTQGSTVHPSQLQLSDARPCSTVAPPEPSTSLSPSFVRASSNPTTTSDPPTQSRSDEPSLADEDDREEADSSPSPPHRPLLPPSAARPTDRKAAPAEVQVLDAGLSEALGQKSETPAGFALPTDAGPSCALPPPPSAVPHPYAPLSPTTREGSREDARPPVPRSASPPPTASSHSPAASLASHSRAPSANRRTLPLPATLSSSLPRLPFFLRGGSGVAPVSPTRAATTSAGPAGYLASLEPHSSGSSPRSPHAAASASAEHAAVPPAPSHRPLPLPSLRRSSQPPTDAAGSRHATFLASVAFALGRLSISQKAAAAAAAAAAVAATRREGEGEGGRAEGGGGSADGGGASPSSGGGGQRWEVQRPSAAVLAVKVAPAGAELCDEVTALSPHSLCSPVTHSSSSFSSAIPTSSPSPLEADAVDPSRPSSFQHGVLPGNYSHRPFHPFCSSTQPPLPFSSSSALSTRYLESWSESDDPMSPASFQQIVPSVYLGSAKSALNVDRLLQHRITHVLTVMNRPLNFHATADDPVDADQLSFGGSKLWHEESTRASIKVPSAHPLFAAAMAGVSVNFVYLLDVPEADLLSALDDCLPYLSYAEQHQRGRVLIHCQAGISRSASVVIAYLVYRFGWTVREAWERCGEARPYINPNDGFVNQLDLFAKGEERKERQSRRRWREQAKRWWRASSWGRQLLARNTATNLRPKPLPREARRSGDDEAPQQTAMHAATWT